MSPLQNLERFLLSAFSPKQLRYWVEGIDASIPDELPGENSSPSDVAHTVVKELARRGIPGDTIFTSLTHERPFLADEIDALRRYWPAPATGDHPLEAVRAEVDRGDALAVGPRRVSVPGAAHRQVTRFLTAGAMLGALALFAAWSWPPTLPLELPGPQTASEPFTLPSPLVVLPFASRPPARQRPAPLQAALQNCYESGCNDAQFAGRPRFCNRTTYVLRLTALQPSFVTFINLFDNQWSIADSKLDLQLQPSTPANAKLYVYTSNAYTGVVPETVVALAFRDAAARQAYRKRFGAARPGPDLPTPAAIGMPEAPWEEARFDYEIDPSCH